MKMILVSGIISLLSIQSLAAVDEELGVATRLAERKDKKQTMKVWLLSASTLCLVVSLSALALTIEQKVTPEYVRSHRNEFSVKVSKDKNGLLAFTVVFTLKEPRYVVAHLAVRDADRTLAESHTPAFTKNPKNTFHFSIAPEYVATSEFRLGASGFAESGGQAVPLPGTIDYQIRLVEFVPAELLKSPTRK